VTRAPVGWPVGWIDSPVFDAHTNGEGHPERRERLLAVREGLAQRNLDSRMECVRAAPAPMEALERVHPAAHINAIRDVCAQGGGRLDGDTSVVQASWDAALAAAGAAVQAVNGVLSGHWQRAFCSVRPPGHHALAAQAMGFCVFDNVAVAAEQALSLGLSRVAILDWDVHHGNGTQDIFYGRGDVLFASWHQYPFYPGSGAEDEVGVGEGVGATVNCPIAQGEGDAAYMRAWETRIKPALDKFAPQLLFISAGFDADERDPLAGLRVTAGGFARLSEAVVRWADANCDGQIVSVLEGGYDLTALREDVPLHVETLL
jgi:acetoin utilization deacetylase AcuC-like enzyme